VDLEGECYEIVGPKGRWNELGGTRLAMGKYPGVQRDIGASSYPVRLAVLAPREPIIAHGGLLRLALLLGMIVAAHSFANWFRPIVAEHLTGRQANAEESYRVPPAKTQDRAPR
jgi:hypothetical protein